MYIILIKDLFKQINMRKSYKKQILDYNIKKFSLMIKNNINKFSSHEILIQANKNIIMQVNFVDSAKKIREKLK